MMQQKRVELLPGTETLPMYGAPMTLGRDFSITARIRRDDTGQGGVIVAHGDLASGYTLYVRVIEGGNGAVGVVSAALLAFTLVYLLATTLLIGAELNGLICERAGIAQPARRLHHLIKRKPDAITRRIRGRR